MKTTLDYRKQISAIASKQELTVRTSKGVELIPIRMPVGQEQVIIDAVNFVTHVETYGEMEGVLNDTEMPESEKLELIKEFIFEISTVLSDIFGSDFSNVTYNGKGIHFYKYGFTIGSNDAKLGTIGIGGQSNTVLIMVTGVGCQYADNYWEHNLYNFLRDPNTINPKLTRIDLAHDDFEGSYSSPEIADTADSQGMFALTNKLPTVQHLGDWKRPTGAGRTLQIGKRENGKLYRGYEKGKKFGDVDSPWFRSEVEFGTAGRHLPFEMLISPTQYFAGAYPYCLELVEHAKGDIFDTVSRIPCTQKEAEISLNKSIEIWKRQAGRYIAAYRELFVKKDSNGNIVSDDSMILDLLQTDKKDFYPKRLRVHEKFIKNPPSYAPWSDNHQKCAIPF
ncbi:replication initiation factor domain-containing protein [Psychrobacter sp. NPDC078501]|uniref:replication initiation factor domain-containing protein n=1 Tax=Psychrobacter sp. NPDC078501 TaxID=3364495 RepID=UPI00385137F7